jgi:hypothetical protein
MPKSALPLFGVMAAVQREIEQRMDCARKAWPLRASRRDHDPGGRSPWSAALRCVSPAMAANRTLRGPPHVHRVERKGEIPGTIAARSRTIFDRLPLSRRGPFTVALSNFRNGTVGVGMTIRLFCLVVLAWLVRLPTADRSWPHRRSEHLGRERARCVIRVSNVALIANSLWRSLSLIPFHVVTVRRIVFSSGELPYLQP